MNRLLVLTLVGVLAFYLSKTVNSGVTIALAVAVLLYVYLQPQGQQGGASEMPSDRNGNIREPWIVYHLLDTDSSKRIVSLLFDMQKRAVFVSNGQELRKVPRDRENGSLVPFGTMICRTVNEIRRTTNFTVFRASRDNGVQLGVSTDSLDSLQLDYDSPFTNFYNRTDGDRTIQEKISGEFVNIMMNNTTEYQRWKNLSVTKRFNIDGGRKYCRRTVEASLADDSNPAKLKYKYGGTKCRDFTIKGLTVPISIPFRRENAARRFLQFITSTGGFQQSNTLRLNQVSSNIWPGDYAEANYSNKKLSGVYMIVKASAERDASELDAGRMRRMLECILNEGDLDVTPSGSRIIESLRRSINYVNCFNRCAGHKVRKVLPIQGTNESIRNLLKINILQHLGATRLPNVKSNKGKAVFAKYFTFDNDGITLDDNVTVTQRVTTLEEDFAEPNFNNAVVSEDTYFVYKLERSLPGATIDIAPFNVKLQFPENEQVLFFLTRTPDELKEAFETLTLDDITFPNEADSVDFTLSGPNDYRKVLVFNQPGNTSGSGTVDPDPVDPGTVDPDPVDPDPVGLCSTVFSQAENVTSCQQRSEIVQIDLTRMNRDILQEVVDVLKTLFESSVVEINNDIITVTGDDLPSNDTIKDELNSNEYSIFDLNTYEITIKRASVNQADFSDPVVQTITLPFNTCRHLVAGFSLSCENGDKTFVSIQFKSTVHNDLIETKIKEALAPISKSTIQTSQSDVTLRIISTRDMTTSNAIQNVKDIFDQFETNTINENVLFNSSFLAATSLNATRPSESLPFSFTLKRAGNSCNDVKPVFNNVQEFNNFCENKIDGAQQPGVLYRFRVETSITSTRANQSLALGRVVQRFVNDLNGTTTEWPTNTGKGFHRTQVTFPGGRINSNFSICDTNCLTSPPRLVEFMGETKTQMEANNAVGYAETTIEDRVRTISFFVYSPRSIDGFRNTVRTDLVTLFRATLEETEDRNPQLRVGGDEVDLKQATNLTTVLSTSGITVTNGLTDTKSGIAMSNTGAVGQRIKNLCTFRNQIVLANYLKKLGLARPERRDIIQIYKSQCK